MIRRKEFDELKASSVAREKEFCEKHERIVAINHRLKASNERLENEVKTLKEDNRLLKEKMDEIIRHGKRREGNTWREINRIVDQVTNEDTKNLSKIEPNKTPKLTDKVTRPNNN